MKRSFDAVVQALAAEPGVSHGKMFASMGLKLGKSVFAMEVKGHLVVKLSEARADELRAKSQASAFDPGHGRVMKQWVTVAPDASVDWVELAREAMRFVGGAAQPSKARRRSISRRS